MENLNSPQLTIEQIRAKRNAGENISPEDYLRLKEYDIQEDKEEISKTYPQTLAKTSKPKKFEVRAWNNYQ